MPSVRRWFAPDSHYLFGETRDVCYGKVTAVSSYIWVWSGNKELVYVLCVSVCE